MRHRNKLTRIVATILVLLLGATSARATLIGDEVNSFLHILGETASGDFASGINCLRSVVDSSAAPPCARNRSGSALRTCRCRRHT
jgi:hypothetical protein